MNLTPAEINERIAHLNGWIPVYQSNLATGKFDVVWKHPESDEVMDKPHDYYTSLEPMWRVLNELQLKSQESFNCYLDNLLILVMGEDVQQDGSYKEITALVLATPMQQAMAYLLTMSPTTLDEKDTPLQKYLQMIHENPSLED